ncbi:MAG: hypothetical protein ACLPQ6_03170 [Steroidobacteraceae bacterium]|jgi:hypothetical protein
MRTVITLMFLMALATAQAQQSPQAARPPAAPVAPPPDQLEPAVDTGAATATPDTTVAAPAGAASAAARKPAAAAAPSGSPKSAARGPKGTDRVELETTDITGNRELPKVLYIVPWKRSDLGDLVGKPANSLLDEVLQPIDREVFLRENRYYDALKPDATAVRAGAVPGSGEKP